MQPAGILDEGGIVEPQQPVSEADLADEKNMAAFRLLKSLNDSKNTLNHVSSISNGICLTVEVSEKKYQHQNNGQSRTL